MKNYKETVKTKIRMIALIIIVNHYTDKLDKEKAYLMQLKQEKKEGAH